MGVGAGGPDGVFGWLCDAAYSGVKKNIGSGAGSVGSAVLGETSDRRTGTDISVVTDAGRGGWDDRMGGGVDRDGRWDFFDAVDAGAELGTNEDGVGGVGGIYFAKFDCGADGKLAIGGGGAGDDGGIAGGGVAGRGDRVLLGGLAVVGCSDQTGAGGGVGGGEYEIVVGMRVGCCWDENDALLRLKHPTLELGLGFGFPL